MPNQNLQSDILNELEIDHLPPEKQEEILTAMTEVILKRLTLRTLENLSEIQRDEFDKICATGDQEKVNQYLIDNVPDYENIVKDEIVQFKKEMKETVDALLA